MNTRTSLIVLVLGTVLVSLYLQSVSGASCDAKIKSKVCKLPSKWNQLSNADRCNYVNELTDTSQPVSNATFQGYDPTCTRALQKDGRGCWSALASLLCTGDCTPCGFANDIKPCYSVCRDIQSSCKHAAKLGYCLPDYNNCEAKGVQCIKGMSVNSNKLKKPKLGL